MNLPDLAGDAGDCVPRRQANGESALVAAYREGFGFTAVAVLRSSGGLRVAAAAPGDDSEDAGAECTERRWWCRRSSDAERVAAAATALWRRRKPRNGAADAGRPAWPCAPGDRSALQLAGESIVHAAKRLNVALQTDEEISAAAMTVAARVDAEIDRLQRSGELKSINKSYRTYRIEASARGERIVRYADWMRKYREKLVRELAAALRYA